MSSKDIEIFEAKLESIIKSFFINQIEQSGDIEIQADWTTEKMLNSIVEKLGLTVYGMSITPSEFTITFEFDSEYNASLTSSNYPRYLKVGIENNGNYCVDIDEDKTKEEWRCSMTDPIFNTKLPEQEISHIVHEYDKVLTGKLLAI